MNGYNFSVIKLENEINKIYSNGLFLSFCFLAFFFSSIHPRVFFWLLHTAAGRRASSTAAAAATAIE
jgi:hypothetical protein